MKAKINSLRHISPEKAECYYSHFWDIYYLKLTFKLLPSLKIDLNLSFYVLLLSGDIQFIFEKVFYSFNLFFQPYLKAIWKFFVKFARVICKSELIEQKVCFKINQINKTKGKIQTNY